MGVRRKLGFGSDMEARVARARREMDGAVEVPCAWGYCVHWVYNGRIVGGAGPVLCPCDHLPGWRSNRVQGQAKPRVRAKAAGPRRDRIERSIRRHELPSWLHLFADEAAR